MILLWVTLLVLHRGYALVPVTTVQLGEPVTLRCDLPDEFRDKLHWFKQSAGETLKLIVRLQKHASPVYGPEFSASRLDVNISNKISSLSILRTIQEDEGMYHCAVMEWTEITWTGTYLSLKGNTQRTSNYTVVQWPTVSDPVRPGASMSLQCSVLSDSENKMCPGDHSVFWFRAGSDQSHPDIVYTDGNRRDECDRNSDTQKSCVYRFSKNVSSSDAGTYYCAVATCGQILFGDGTKVEIERTRSLEFIALVIVTVCLVISLTGNIVFICYRNTRPAYPQFRDTLVPVTTVQLGEPVTLTCDLPGDEFRDEVFWYKQSAGETLKLTVRLLKHGNPVYGPEISASRLHVKIFKNISSLSILRTIQEDEGMYHCAVMEWTEITWSGTYLSLKGNTQRTSNYAVVQWPTVSDPVRPEALMSLQCSVLSDSENKMCPGDHSVFWFRAGSDKSHPDIIYTDGNRRDECDRNSDTQKSCVYRFSKNISSSDAGTYYCAVATCGQILFGDGTKVEIERTRSFEFIALVIVTVCLVISLTGNIVFICYRNTRPACPQFRGIESGASQRRYDNWSQPVHDITEGGPDMNYAALHFSGNKATRGRKKKELKTEESVYSQVKCSL
ncbi:hypothetical protein ABVT39_017368 [Epinephelus coioides]